MANELHVRYDASGPVRVTESLAVAVNGTHTAINVAPGFPHLGISVASLSATTVFTLKLDVAGQPSTVDPPKDLDDNTYPRTGFLSGEILQWVAMPTCGYSVTASVDTGVTGTLTYWAWGG